MNQKIEKANRIFSNKIAEFQMLMAHETEDLQLDRETVDKGVNHIFDHPEKGEYWLAFDGEKVIASLLVLYEWSDWRNGSVIWVHSVYVLKQYRKSGVFSAMYRKLKENVQTDPSFKGIRLYVEKTNVVAQNVYKKLGMSSEHYDLYEWLAS
jgi:ribosomal protein S18 acetylase RimI-like enzyme